MELTMDYEQFHSRSSPTEGAGLIYYDTPSNEKMDINRGFLTTGEIV
jgi:hypothetical protein